MATYPGEDPTRDAGVITQALNDSSKTAEELSMVVEKMMGRLEPHVLAPPGPQPGGPGSVVEERLSSSVAESVRSTTAHIQRSISVLNEIMNRLEV